MAICGCGSPARCCQPAVAGGFIYADLRSELSSHLAPLALFTQSSTVLQLLLQAFPFSSTLGEVTLHLLSQACIFVYSSHGKWVFPPLLPLPLLPALRSWLLGVCRGSCLLQLACEGFPLLPSSALRAPRPLCYVSFLLLLLIIQGFFSFSLGGGWSVQGAMLIWPRMVCGSIACHLAHPVVCIFPSHLGAAVWRRRGSPPGFSI
jgi:hypothetical protein